MKRTKLALKKQTIQQLKTEALSAVAGGGDKYSAKATACGSQAYSCFEGPCTIPTIIDL
jgi:hypothetical protein